MQDVFVKSFTHLKDRPHADRALHILQRVASLTKPIMRKHNWVLPVLSEFFPDSANLLGLNINGGEKILLRLRPSFAPDTFFPEEDVVQTMLHELTHNMQGPHDEKFYKLLAGLQEEYEALKRSGYDGEGFFSEGKRVGANVSHNLSPHAARAKALEAAEKRRQKAGILGGGGKLGGRTLGGRQLTPREAAVQAAERRIRDEKECANGEVAQREAAKAAKESVQDNVIDLTMDDSGASDEDVIIIDEKPNPIAAPPKIVVVPKNVASKPALSGGSSKKSNVASTAKVLNAPSTIPSANPVQITKPKLNATKEWACNACTLINPGTSYECDACRTRRPPDESDGWTCLFCGETGMQHDFWSCRVCGTIKARS